MATNTATAAAAKKNNTAPAAKAPLAKPADDEASKLARAAEMAAVDAAALAEFESMGDGFVELQNDYYTWKAELCASSVLRGYFVGQRTLESDANGEFDSYFFITTRPTLAVKGKATIAAPVPEHRMVSIVANAVLKNLLSPLLGDPSLIYEVAIVSAGKVPTKSGFDANMYKVKVAGTPVPYETIKPLLMQASANFERDAAEFPPAS